MAVKGLKSKSSLDELLERFAPQEDKYIRTGVLAFDLMTEGLGLPCSGFIHLWGPYGTGKSTLTASIAKGIADQGYKTLLVQVEPSDKLLRDMGLREPPYDELIRVVNPVFYNEAEEVFDAFMDAPDYALMVLDSVSQLAREVATEKKVEESQVAEDAVTRVRFVKRVAAVMRRANSKAMIQVYHATTNFDRMSPYDPKFKTEGGQRPQQFSVMALSLEGGRVIDNSDGTRAGRDVLLRPQGKNRFSKFAVPKFGSPMRILFGQGVSNSYTMAAYCIWKGYIQRGAWNTCSFGGKEDKVQGKDGLHRWLEDNWDALNQDFYENAKGFIDGLLGGFTPGEL